jgi:predicted ABC-type ATPase
MKFFIEILETAGGLVLMSFVVVKCVEIRIERIEARQEEKTIGLNALLENIEERYNVKREVVEIRIQGVS